MTEQTTTETLRQFPIRRECPFTQPAAYAALRTDEPVARVTLPTGKQAWILTRYDDVRSVLADPSISADARHENLPALGLGEREAAAKSRPFIRTDPPEHTRYRRMLQAEFTVKRVKSMRPGIQSTVDRLIDEMEATGPTADYVPAFANAVSTSTVLELAGVPTADLEFFRDVTRISGGRNSSEQEVTDALGNMFRVLGELVDRRTTDPGEDLLSKLVVNHLLTGEADRQEVLSTIGITIIAGRETTTNMIALGTLLLLERPELLAALRADLSRVPDTVEELLRVLSIADSIPLRVATRDMDVSGTRIPAGDGIIALLGAANTDPEVFGAPDEIDLSRAGRHHMAFGYGIHQCIGQNLARLELEIALGTILRRMPDLRLAVPFAELEFKHDAATFGLESMPVAW
ncbi:cytochrome P450 [Saccharopolyspora sp. NPDC000995]